jgi:flagellar basal body-associated protein FliL
LPPPRPRKSRRLLFILLALAATVLVLAVAGVAVTLGIQAKSGANFAVNSCVKQDGSRAREAKCSDPNAYVIVNKVDKQEHCPDPNQPVVVLEHGGGRDEVLCLRKANQK